jgi:DNA repair exonuclease SbcCD ATPase subunit
MSRKTAQELLDAKRRKQEERRNAEAARKAEVARLRSRLTYLRENADRTSQLKSVLDGLYLEMDKLSKKAPADEVTELALRKVNAVIARCKELMQGDEFIDSVDVFVAAGERPEHRDVVLVLSELKQGIDRLEGERRSLVQQSERWGAGDEEEDES